MGIESRRGRTDRYWSRVRRSPDGGLDLLIGSGASPLILFGWGPYAGDNVAVGIESKYLKGSFIRKCGS